MLWRKTESTFQKNFWCSDDKMHRLPFLALLFVPPGADLKKNKENSAFLRKSGRILCFPSTRPGHRHSLQPQPWKILKHRWQGENPFNIFFLENWVHDNVDIFSFAQAANFTLKVTINRRSGAPARRWVRSNTNWALLSTKDLEPGILTLPIDCKSQDKS